MSDQAALISRAIEDQRRAANPKQSVWVSANAGTGKTKVLTDRIARLLLEGAEPAQILAVTYTKAAASEMKSRLFKVLGKWAIDDDSKLIAALNALEGRASDTPVSALQLSRARRLFARALDTPGGLRILTIHAFCTTVLQRFPLEAGIAPGFSVIEDTEAENAATAARERLLDGGEKHRAAYELLAAEFDGDRFNGLLKAAKGRRRERDLVFAQGLDSALERLRNVLGVDPDATEHEIIVAAILDISRLAPVSVAALRAAGSVSDSNLADAIEAALGCPEPERKFGELSKALLTKGQPKKPTLSAKAKANLAAMKFAKLADFPGSGEAVDLVLATIETLKALRTYQRTAAFLRLSETYAHAYAREKSARGALDFDDLLAKTSALLNGSNGEAAWVLYKLDQGIEHVLIDEAQDTSPDQWDLLQPLFDELEAGSGARNKVRTRFIVGDEKQSIYSFQGADPQRFLDEAARFGLPQRNDRSSIALGLSWRTTQTVLDAVDDVWGSDSVKPETKFLDTKRHTAQRQHDSGRVELWGLSQPTNDDDSTTPIMAPVDYEKETSPKQQLALAIAETVARWLDATTPLTVYDPETGQPRAAHAGDVMILVRERTSLFENIIRRLKEKKVPVAGADKLSLADELAVMDLIALARVALLPEDDLNVAIVLRGPFAGLVDDDADLLPLSRSQSGKWSFYEALMAREEERYQPARALLSNCRAQAAILSPYEFFASILERPHLGGKTGWELLIERLGPEVREPVEAFLAKALAHGREPAPSLERFLFEIVNQGGEIKREQDQDSRSVRVMTVHGAKGLEAPIVILPDTTSAPKTKSDGLFFDDDAKVWILATKQEDDPAKAAAMREASKARALGEHLRLLYVAMTRARDRLIICGAWYGGSKHKTGYAKDSWYDRISSTLGDGEAIDTPCGPGRAFGSNLLPIAQALNAIEPQAGDLTWAHRVPPHEAPAPRRAAPSTLYVDSPEPSAVSPVSGKANRFRRGTLIHELLQRLPDLPPSARPKAATARLAREITLTEAERADIITEAFQVIDHADFAPLFATGSRAEVSIAGKVSDLDVVGSIDRLVITSDSVLILDYKTNKPPPKREADVAPLYMRQMALYRAVLSQIYPSHAIRCALVWTDEPRLMELSASLLDAALQDVMTLPKSAAPRDSR